MKIVITGATGYIGARLVRYAVSRGHEVIAASRKASITQVDWIPFDLASPTEIRLPSGVETVFHLAAATTLSAVDPCLETAAAMRLIEAAEQVGARIVFVSSQTARKNAPTVYGRTKWNIERLVLAAGGWVIRPGQVYGGPERALFGLLVNVVQRLPVIPAFFPSPKIQPVHVNDLVVALLQCVELNTIPSSVLCVGSPVPVSFTSFLRTIALVRVRRYRLPIPVPVFLVHFAGVLVGRHLSAKLGLDRLASLFNLPTMETERDLQRLGMSLRSLSSGMARSGNDQRRALIREGCSFLSYVLKTRPTKTLVRRYVRSINSLRGGQPLQLPEIMLRYPVVIALLDQSNVLSGSSGTEFVWRLNAAVVLAEASIQGARRFLVIGKPSGFITSLAHVAHAVALEVWWRILRMVVLPVLRPVLRNSGLAR